MNICGVHMNICMFKCKHASTKFTVRRKTPTNYKQLSITEQKPNLIKKLYDIQNIENKQFNIKIKSSNIVFQIFIVIVCSIYTKSILM